MSKSYLAICKDKPNDPSGFIYTVYFVNQTDDKITDLGYKTCGYMTDDDDLIETSLFEKNLGGVPDNSFIEIENDDEGSFDFIIHFSFNIAYASSRKENKDFRIAKYLGNGTEKMNIPILNKPGYVFEGERNEE